MDTSLPRPPTYSQQNGHGGYEQELCPFWEKVGSCRHGAQCVRYHERPKQSKTLLFRKLFKNPVRTVYHKPSTKKPNSKDKNDGEFILNDVKIDEETLNRAADRLYQDLFVEFALKYGEIDDIVICGNYNPHIGGNVIVKFKDERSAHKCYSDCIDRWYDERPLFCELSPIKNLGDAICSQFASRGRCDRGDQCNLIHVRRPRYDLKNKLIASQRSYYKDAEI